MALAAGTSLGPYEILTLLGAGGMGEVYRARDTRLERTVAIKVLNPALTSTPEHKARFEREARIISQLQHPHICVLHDIGHNSGTDFLVMEFIEGESLADRLRRGSLRTDELLKFAIQIADALDKAHRAGVVHRDLKPANVMLTKSGTAKLLDFGLAKSLCAAGSAATGSSSQGFSPSFTAAPTIANPSPLASPLTTQGTIVGTIQYMSPEQIEGKEADIRSDIFSFGAMLYEMTTGRRPFEGKSQIKVASAILEDDPAPIDLPHSSPALKHVITSCLEKNPEDRFQSAADVKLELNWAAEAPGTSAFVAREAAHFSLVTWIAIVVALAAITTALYFGSITLQPKPVLHAALLVPAKVSLHTGRAVPVVSPDGTKLAFSGVDDKGTMMLYVRQLNSSEAHALPGTQGAAFPFWSPDSQSIGFFADKRLKRIDAAGGLAQDLAEAPSARGGTWSNQGVILYRAGGEGVLQQVPAGGGAISPASKLESGENHSWPSFLPDGTHYLFSCGGKAECVGDLGSMEHKVIHRQGSPAIYASGYLLFPQGQTLVAEAFNLRKLATTGDAVPISDNVVLNSGYGTANFSASNTGILVYQAGDYAAAWPLAWYARDGKSLGNLGEPSRYARAAISPDGNRVAVSEYAADGGRDIWMFDIARETHTRYTFDGVSVSPVWTADGREIVYSKKGTLYRKPSDNSAQEEMLAHVGIGAVSASADGRYLAFMHGGEGTEWDIWGLALQGDHKPFPVIQTPASEVLPALSPDSKFLAYCSDESGSSQVYISLFPNGGAKSQVTTGGGCEPRWRGDGKELFFSDGNGGIWAVDVAATENSVVLGTPHLLFRAKMQSSGPLGSFDVTRDGKTFLVNSTGTQGGDALTVVTNWTEALRK